MIGAAEPPPGDMWMVAALSALAAAFTIEVFKKGQPRMQQVMEISERIQVPTNLKTTP
jgi:hypothetical protein